MKRMLINATQPEELRVAMVDGQRLFDLDIEVPTREQKKSNIYKGKITRIEPSLEAAFVDFGAERHGFLPLKEISKSYFKEGADTSGRINIKEVLNEGQEVIVQVDKEERGNKGAALTTFISLAGRFLVLMPNNPRAGGVSRRIEGEDREAIREALAGLNTPNGMGSIVRTAGVGRNVEELQWDQDYLLQVWQAIEKASTEKSAPFLIYQESNVIIRALRDYLRNDIGEILIDDDRVFDQARDFMTQVMPHNLPKLKLYEDRVPLFTRFQIESQIESAFRREVRLPAGGAIVIDHTEALISIDINSARATKGSDIEETAFNTNLEAADEVARQLKLRDMGGLVVIDFIDMSSNRNQRTVEDRLRDAVKADRARVQIGRISRFGLLEMSRQRLRPSLGESSQTVCPRCNGEGRIRGVESLALSVLRLIEEEAMKDSTARVVVQLPVAAATYLLNEKRSIIAGLEHRFDVGIVLVPNQHMDTPDYEIQRLRTDEADAISDNSYQMAIKTEDTGTPDYLQAPATRSQAQQPAVKSISPATPAPKPTERKTVKPGLIARIFAKLGGSDEQDERKTGDRKPRDRNNSRTRGGSRNEARSNEAKGNEQTRNRRSSPRRTSANANANDKRKQATGNKARSEKTETRQHDSRNADNRQQSSSQPSRQRAQAAKDSNKQAETAADSKQTDKAAAPAGKPAADDNQQSRNTRRGRRGGRRRRGGRNRNRTQETENANDNSNNSNANNDASSAERTSATKKAVATDNKTANDNTRPPSISVTPAPQAEKPQQAEKQPRVENKPQTEHQAQAVKQPQQVKKPEAGSVEKTPPVERSTPSVPAPQAPQFDVQASKPVVKKPQTVKPTEEKLVQVHTKSNAPKPESKEVKGDNRVRETTE